MLPKVEQNSQEGRPKSRARKQLRIAARRLQLLLLLLLAARRLRLLLLAARRLLLLLLLATRRLQMLLLRLTARRLQLGLAARRLPWFAVSAACRLPDPDYGQEDVRNSRAGQGADNEVNLRFERPCPARAGQGAGRKGLEIRLTDGQG